MSTLVTTSATTRTVDAEALTPSAVYIFEEIENAISYQVPVHEPTERN